MSPGEAAADGSVSPSPRTRGGIGAFTAASVALCLLAVLALAVGKFPVHPLDVARVLASAVLGMPSDLAPAIDTVVLQVRLPRVASALLVGAALAAAGCTYQALFRNPLVSPDILGVSSGAAFGAVLGIFLSLPVAAIQGLGFAGGIAAVAAVLAITRAVRSSHDAALVLVLAGVVVGSLLGAGVSLLTWLADPYDQLPAIAFWLLGSLASVKAPDLASLALPVLVGLVPLALLRWRVNLMSLGEEEARALGVETGRIRAALIVAATLMTAAAVSQAGVVGWVGLVVPHLARMLVGPDFVRLLPASALLGAAYLLGVDTAARMLGATEIPLGVLNAALGAPFFLWLLARTRRPWT
ncbi:FecCD family ABC transporter permease [Arenibaculum pallidiluteum]|uniref:FecCD family ABC transporter permease n=1 Tax=Arenibaculum pallidiluteum TaxID=2812559 RepID=UPI002E2ADCC2|nr:iron ABC transporter permease [Arenibaculum pallidiluteum]